MAGVKSNAILLAKDLATVGIGAGQMSRVDSSKLAVRKAGRRGWRLAWKGACWLLMRSSRSEMAWTRRRKRVRAAIIQPGGSIRDEEVVAAADEHGIAMVFTGRRLFRH